MAHWSYRCGRSCRASPIWLSVPLESLRAYVPRSRLLGQRYRDAGITDITVRIYPSARHEIFNETNRDEITADVVSWLTDHLAAKR